jgi:exosortase family protein XrtG
MRPAALPVLYWVVAAIWLVLYLFLQKARAWLLAYMLGTVGFTLLVVYAFRGSAVESFIERTSALSAHYLSSALGIPTKVFFNAPGTLLVLIVYQEVGWTAIEIDIECSGLLEFMVFTGLMLFFNGFTWKYRATVLPLGIAATFVMNVVRIAIIVATIHFGGKNMIYVAHTVVGRAIFFMMVIALYWYVFTRATSQAIHRRLTRD